MCLIEWHQLRHFPECSRCENNWDAQFSKLEDQFLIEIDNEEER
ncbi:MAG: hypothetical protein AABW79_01875 [Nanoarchaeota archaeon]